MFLAPPFDITTQPTSDLAQDNCRAVEMAYTDDAVKAKLSALNETQESIVTVAQWVMFHRYGKFPVAHPSLIIPTDFVFAGDTQTEPVHYGFSD